MLRSAYSPHEIFLSNDDDDDQEKKHDPKLIEANKPKKNSDI